MIKELAFVTNNQDKAEQLSWHLDYPLVHLPLELDEIQSLDLIEVAKAKSMTAWKQAQRPVLVEDMGLSFHAFGRLPGPLIKWFYQELGNEGLLDLLKDHSNRQATASVVFAYYDGQTEQVFTGKKKGQIAKEASGKGFAWDSIFIPQGETETWAEMNIDKQKKTSVRAIALEKVSKFLRNN